MSAHPIMVCGCAANARRDDGRPSCAVHGCADIAPEQPDLTGRRARCAYCKKERDSDRDLPFFEFRGSGSPEAAVTCKHCGYHKPAHERDENRVRPEPAPETLDHDFEPHGAFDFDRYYCGCRGWD